MCLARASYAVSNPLMRNMFVIAIRKLGEYGSTDGVEYEGNRVVISMEIKLNT